MWNGSITVVAVGSFSLAAVLDPVNLSIATTTFIPSSHALGRGASHAFERGFGVALDHVEQPGRSGPGPDRGQVA